MKSHDRMIAKLTDYERNNEMINELYRVYGEEADDILYEIDDLYKQMNIDTATWGLTAWEISVGLDPIESMSYEQRRARIKTRLKGHNKIDLDILESAVQDLYSNKVYLRFNGKILFDLPLEGETGLDLHTIHTIINRLKPAHLGYDISLYMKPITSNLYFGAIGQSGEEIVLYPILPKDPIIEPSLFIGAIYDGISEEIYVDGFTEHDKIDAKLDVRNLGNLINQLEQIVLYSNSKDGDKD